ncbi:uncharacterized protein [Montipora foliosa]|uniref:uncharacterized protein n=1 Tax=Montipora foliosa TaxID=591990 RepID=UPI0035F107A4
MIRDLIRNYQQKVVTVAEDLIMASAWEKELPRPAEGGRLECDRIIMDDGTAIHFFDENDDSGVRGKAHRRSRERQDENHRSGFFVTLCSSWGNGCSVYSGCYRTRLGSTGGLRRHITLRWGNRKTRGKPLPDFVAKESGGDGKGILSEQKQKFADYTSTV